MRYYRSCGSIRQTASHFEISPQKCRRLLISSGDWQSPAASRILDLWDQGLSAADIASLLGMRLKTVQAYIPYTKGAYLSDSPTRNALAIRRCRANKQ